MFSVGEGLLLFCVIVQMMLMMINDKGILISLQFCQYPRPAKVSIDEISPYERYSNVLTNLNMAFTLVFFIEATLKIIAFGPKVQNQTLVFSHFCEDQSIYQLCPFVCETCDCLMLISIVTTFIINYLFVIFICRLFNLAIFRCNFNLVSLGDNVLWDVVAHWLS